MKRKLLYNISIEAFFANNEPKSALARDLGDCRDNKGKLAKRVFTCLIGLNVAYMENDRIKKV